MPFVLAIDDEPAVLAAVRRILCDLPVPLLFAASAEGAISSR